MPSGSNSNNRGDASRRSNKGNTSNSNGGYVDIIDRLDLSGLGMSVHHSGPFDAARAPSARSASGSNGSSSSNNKSPIGAFSRSALDPSVSPKGADLAPFSTRRAGGAGLSERARAALAASGEGADPDASSENLLGSPGARARRNSESSITLGQYGNAKNEKERQYLEAFGVHGEAYEDFGNSRYARQAPRASVYPGELQGSSRATLQDSTASSGPLTPLNASQARSAFRADRTASIWDIEATLREGRPVGASAAPPPPMPVMPSQYLSPSSASSSPEGSAAPVKRSKSLIHRMRSKKTPISNPVSSSADTSREEERKEDLKSSVSSAAMAPTLSYGSGSSGSGNGYVQLDSPSAEHKSSYLPPVPPTEGRERPPMVPRRTTDRSNASLSHASPPGYASRSHSQSKLSSASNPRPMRQQSADLLGVIDIKNPSPSPTHTGAATSSPRRSQSARAPARSRGPAPSPSPLGLPEPGDYFSASTNGGGGMTRSGKYADLANESATAAFLAESSSKESGMASGQSSSSLGGGTAENSFASSTTASANASTRYDEGSPYRERERDDLGSSTGSKMGRKPSLVGRLLRGGKKKQQA